MMNNIVANDFFSPALRKLEKLRFSDKVFKALHMDAFFSGVCATCMGSHRYASTFSNFILPPLIEDPACGICRLNQNPD